MEAPDRTLDEAAAALGKAAHVAVLTGAGISAESGIPTFRDALEGLWAKYDPAQLATPEAFRHDPELVTRWYDMRRGWCAEATPNEGHHAVTRLQRALAERGRRLTILTQNIDGLHQRAGTTDVVELHGSIAVWHCSGCGRPAPDLPPALPRIPMPCDCRAWLRPSVVWFGEALPEDAVRIATDASSTCDLFISVGTSAIVYPAAGFIQLAASRRVPTIEVNRDPTPLTGGVTWALTGRAGDILPRLVRAAFESKSA